jgi:hypothetical protein
MVPVKGKKKHYCYYPPTHSTLHTELMFFALIAAAAALFDLSPKWTMIKEYLFKIGLQT